MSLNHIMIPNGPGSWIKDARWDEYVATVRNLTTQALTVEKIRLVDPRGVYIEEDVNPWQLEKASEQLAEQYRTAGIMVALHSAPTAVSGLALDIGGLGGLAAAGAASVVLAPGAAIGAPVYWATTQYANVKDREDIEREFGRRQITSVTLAGNVTITGSRFFPIVPNPQALVIDYRIQQESKVLESL